MLALPGLRRGEQKVEGYPGLHQELTAGLSQNEKTHPTENHSFLLQN